MMEMNVDLVIMEVQSALVDHKEETAKRFNETLKVSTALEQEQAMIKKQLELLLLDKEERAKTDARCRRIVLATIVSLFINVASWIYFAGHVYLTHRDALAPLGRLPQ
jgi:hypothetical protein